MSYIEREAFLAEQRHLYCENCARRKNGKGKFVYDIGDAPCRACGIMDVLDAVEDAPAADVQPVVRGTWTDAAFTADNLYDMHGMLCQIRGYICSCCHEFSLARFNFCPNCGATMEES